MMARANAALRSLRAEARQTAAMMLPLALALGSTGCINQMLVDGQIKGTRKASDAADTIADYELAKSATEAGLVQFEGMHTLSPNNEDALFLLTKGWTGYGFAFVDDERERAADAGDEARERQEQLRALMAYDRAISYGSQLLSQRADGMEAAMKTETTLKAWLHQFEDAREDASNLFWTGYAFLVRADLMKSRGDPVAIGAVGALYIGVAMIERAVQLDPAYANYSGILALASYHARPMVDAAELEQSRQLFETALARTERKNLMVQVNYARAYACSKGDRALYASLLAEVLEAHDPDPQQRLTNAVAVRRAQRYLLPAHQRECGFQ